MKIEIELRTLDDTERMASRLAALCGRGDILALSGPLGAGKTAFARAFIRARLGDPELIVPSPTFTLVQTYEPENPDEPGLWHVDLYRIEGPDETFELGLEEAALESILLIEWPDRWGSGMPAGRLMLELEPAADEARRLRITGEGDWSHRLGALVSDAGGEEAGRDA